MRENNIHCSELFGRWMWYIHNNSLLDYINVLMGHSLSIFLPNSWHKFGPFFYVGAALLASVFAIVPVLPL